MTLTMPILSEHTFTFLGVDLKIFKQKICRHVKVNGLVDESLGILFTLFKQLKFLLTYLRKISHVAQRIISIVWGEKGGRGGSLILHAEDGLVWSTDVLFKRNL